MTGDGGIMKRTYDLVALFVLFNVLGLGGIAAYLLTSGAIDGATLRTIGMVLKGEDLVPAMDVEQEVAPDAEQPAKKTKVRRVADFDNDDPRAQMEIELLQLESERVQVELDQRLKLINSILLRVENERKAFSKERSDAVKTDAAKLEMRRDEGFEKQVAIFQALSPKVAVQHLLGMNNPSEAAKLLAALDTDKARKIVEAARRGADLVQMQAILQHLRDSQTAPSEQLGDSAP